MIKLNYFLAVSLMLSGFLLSPIGIKANWLNNNKSEPKGIETIQSNNSDHSNASRKNDSLPEGVTDNWLNSLEDENGNKIIQNNTDQPDKPNQNQEDPEGDAFQRKIFTGLAAGDQYGLSVSSAGDVNNDGFDDVIIGALYNDGGGTDAGRAYIYFGGANMNNAVDLILTGEAANDYFGFSVSSAGDVNGDDYDDVIVGAPYNDAGGANTGRAYIYFGGASMNSISDLILTGTTAGDLFGFSVSSAGDVNNDGYDDVIAGAYNNDAGGFNAGRAYVYLGGAVMNNTADVFLTGLSANDNFGFSVSSAGDVNDDGFEDVIVGAYNNDAGGSNAGRAYIYFGGTVMNNTADKILTGEAANDNFGYSVSSAGDVNGDGFSDVIVGGYNNDAGGSNAGRAYVYFGGSTMNTIADITMTGEAAGDNFGNSVSSAGDLNGDGYSDVIVGALYNDAGGVNVGRTYVYFGGTSMSNLFDVTMTGEAANDLFGYSVSSAGDVNGDGYDDVIVGAPYNDAIGVQAGRVYIYDYFMKNEIIPDLSMTGETVDYQLGYSVSSAGDVNGDGYDDVIVGAYNNNAGNAYIFYGGISMNNTADVIMTTVTGGDGFGISVSSAGDVNGDGFDDVIIGAYYHNLAAGRAYVFLGGTSMNNTTDVILSGANFNSLFGWSVSSAGDMNGDGYSDVIVGSVGDISGGSNPGKAYVYYGGASMNNTADLILTGANSNENFGRSVSSAGDVNDDGYSDVIVGATLGGFGLGRAYVYFGGNTINNIVDAIFTGEAVDDEFGFSVSSAGDVNGDGYDDMIIGAYGNDAGGTNAGRAYIYFGGVAISSSPDLVMTGVAASDGFGHSVSSAGDVNGDGYEDVIVGAYGNNAGGTNAGRAYVYYGGSSMNNIADVYMTGDAANDNFGYSVSSAGDVNGDGYIDLIVGAPDNDESAGNAGMANLYYASAISTNNVKTLNLTIFIEGFYYSGINLQVSDTINVEIRNKISPYVMMDQAKGVVANNGTVQMLFSNSPNGDYYLTIKHRNSIETWSAIPQTFLLSTPLNYNLSSSSSQAFGSNQIQIDASPLRFAMYSGDVNQDGTIDLSDGSLIDNDAFNFGSGYLPTDVNGDEITDLADAVFADNNGFNFVSKITP